MSAARCHFRARAFPFLWVCLLACSHPGAPAGDKTPPVEPAGSEMPAETDSPPPPPPPVSVPEPARPAPPAPSWRGAYCQADDECNWDHSCFPRRCVGTRTAHVTQECDKTLPEPGVCSCVENQCSLRPERPIASPNARGCSEDSDCAVDVASATCHAGGQSRIGPIRSEGPLCTCERSSGTCVFQWAEPVACKSWRDCSWTRQPRLRPVSAQEVPRPFKGKVKPCHDSEIDSVCTDEGICRVMAWKC